MWHEPRVADPPRRVWRDWALLSVLAPAAVVEIVVRSDIVWPPFSLGLTLAMLPMLLWRRTHPLLATAGVFGTISVVNIVTVIAGVGSVGLYTLAAMLILPYALFRWGSGREAAIGLAFMAAAFVTGSIVDSTSIGDVIGGAIVILFPAELGAVVRYQANLRQQAIEQARSSTREQLARELHDSVAHHVSAIAIQAQGGRAAAAADPEKAVDVLGVIEEEAARALAEMRNMVGALRDDEKVDFAPQPGVTDIERLAELDLGGNGTAPRIEVELQGNLFALQPSVDTALYRLAQESITNALRHARNASRVLVRVVGEEDSIALTVEDDGVHNPPPVTTSGFGLVGMAERAKLLGGTLDAGPRQGRGWTVNAVLPRKGSPA